ncbi:hypothetical protein AB0425_32190 [Actinosynnema sp. NPDC051121]
MSSRASRKVGRRAAIERECQRGILGLTLDEVIDALHAHHTGGATCESERWRLEAVVDRKDAKIAELEQARQHAKDILEAAPIDAPSSPDRTRHCGAPSPDVELATYRRPALLADTPHQMLR